MFKIGVTNITYMFVISVGGSVIGYPPDTNFLSRFSSFVKKHRKNIYAIVPGGGPIAKTYIETVLNTSGDKFIADMTGWSSCILNGYLLLSFLKDVVPEKLYTYGDVPPTTPYIAIPAGVPTFTSDATAALIAEKTGSDLINITAVGGVYDRDPHTYKDSKLLRKVSADELFKTLASMAGKPKLNFPVDIQTLMVIKRSGIKAYVVPPDMEVLERLMDGELIKGTEITR